MEDDMTPLSNLYKVHTGSTFHVFTIVIIKTFQPKENKKATRQNTTPLMEFLKPVLRHNIQNM